MMCHSDKLQGENEEFTKKANEIFSELNEAYHQKNLKRVKEILRDLENGKAFESVFSKSLMDDVEKMKRRFMELLEKLKVLQKKLYELLESEEYKKVVQISDRENHFLTVKESLETQIKQLKKEIKAFGD
jgi:predicted nuclease with TOPRIM domain